MLCSVVALLLQPDQRRLQYSFFSVHAAFLSPKQLWQTQGLGMGGTGGAGTNTISERVLQVAIWGTAGCHWRAARGRDGLVRC